MTVLKVIVVSVLLSFSLGAYATFPAFSRTFKVDCDAGRTITRALKRARDGDTILVRGACTESVTIDKSIILDGGGSASISPDSPVDRTISVIARDVTIKGFSLESPAVFQIAAFGGATASIESNIIRLASNFGVSAATNSFLVLLDNTITDNTSGVISISGGNVRAGVRFFSDVPMPNLIANNLQNGVLVISNSTADLLGGNTISGNGVGVVVADGGHARIAGNVITANQVGVLSDTNATVQLPLAANPNPLLTALNNGVNNQFGIACRGGSIAGISDGLAPAVALPPLTGTLTGSITGLATFCLDQTQTMQ